MEGILRIEDLSAYTSSLLGVVVGIVEWAISKVYGLEIKSVFVVFLILLFIAYFMIKAKLHSKNKEEEISNLRKYFFFNTLAWIFGSLILLANM